MRTEDLFEHGVTPKEGPRAGERFTVKSIDKDYVYVRDGNHTPDKFEHGTYEVWREPSTLFDDPAVPSTWGNLKKAAEQAGLEDDTPILVVDFDLLSDRIIHPAKFTLNESTDGGKILLIV